MSYTLVVNIDPSDVTTLKDGGYNLCLTKFVKDLNKEQAGNVVFASLPAKYLSVTQPLEWSENYQVYMTNTFEIGAKASPSTQVAPIKAGDQVKFKDNGTYDTSYPGKKTMDVRNEWQRNGRIGVKTLDKRTGNYSSIFISPPREMNATDKLQPLETVMAFFNSDYTTDTMIDSSQTDSITVPFGDHTTATVLYKEGKWTRIN